jgi:hypothetical protein
MVPQSRVISGVVTDGTAPVPGATIHVEGGGGNI